MTTGDWIFWISFTAALLFFVLPLGYFIFFVTKNDPEIRRLEQEEIKRFDKPMRRIRDQGHPDGPIRPRARPRVFNIVFLALCFVYANLLFLDGDIHPLIFIPGILYATKVLSSLAADIYWTSNILDTAEITVDDAAFIRSGRLQGKLVLPRIFDGCQVHVEFQSLLSILERIQFFRAGVLSEHGRPLSLREGLKCLFPLEPVHKTLTGKKNTLGSIDYPFTLLLGDVVQRYAAKGFKELSFWSRLRVTVERPDRKQRCQFLISITPNEGRNVGSKRSLPLL